MNANRSGMGGHAPHGQHDASDARFVACPGKAEGRKEAERPPALQAPPRPHSRRKRHSPPPPPARPCQLELTPLGSALSPQRWRVNLGASRGEGVYKRRHRPWWPVFPCSPSQRADRQPGGTSPALGRGGRRSDGAAVPPLPPCTSVGDPAVPLSASCPRARQSAVRRCFCPPLTPVHVSRRSDGAAPHPAPSPPVPAPYT